MYFIPTYIMLIIPLPQWQTFQIIKELQLNSTWAKWNKSLKNMLTIIWKNNIFFPIYKLKNRNQIWGLPFLTNFHKFPVEIENLIEKENVYHTWLWLFLLLKWIFFKTFSNSIQIYLNFSIDIFNIKRKLKGFEQKKIV